MAGASSDYHRGEMDIAEQQATFNLVMGMTKWGSLYLAAILLLLVLWFCVPAAGFLTGVVSAVVVVALGTFFLRDKPSEAH
ncbi:MAG: aa3-type cytochrome c oxidase subunit IV [Phenylobacterium sp.]|uniref:aa3-type cytochrome c oxidase subunit IV n=1 Tax=Phenylobacterium sp. TaxID=1871053 RepID=UPI0025FC99F8|nr:aa3-type cytochrome c oxidase subunit IV [Phenylobacterium sp.]MBI1199523.1 aa3-type cytochrome c oxidase subunit IV [Phenylobacterium sp.]